MATATSIPRAATRPAVGVQRGSVQDMPIYPGDPLTPGVGATADAKRLTRADAPTILKIPVAADVLCRRAEILSRLGGPVVAGGLRTAALPFTYHIGGDGAVKVHLAVKSDWSLKPIYDVIATHEGRDLSRPMGGARQPS